MMTLSFLATSFGYPVDLVSLHFRPAECQCVLEQAMAVAAKQIELPHGECIDITNANTTLRALFAAACKSWCVGHMHMHTHMHMHSGAGRGGAGGSPSRRRAPVRAAAGVRCVGLASGHGLSAP